ncbi:MAG: hypothetical protein WCE62_01770 [Polyangiales bacterium]
MSRYRKTGSLWRSLGEMRAPLELATTLAAFPFLAGGPRGDAHSSIVLPGLFASDTSTATLRAFLRSRGYNALGWGLGRNPGFGTGLLDAMVALTQAEFRRSGRPVSLVGWSLGGVYARETARKAPDAVRCVITLGSPIQLDERTRRAPPVPSTAIFSVSDGVVAPHWAREITGDRTENIEVPGSHFGLGYNPFVLHAVADRLRQRPDDWKSFEVSGLVARFYRGGPIGDSPELQVR